MPRYIVSVEVSIVQTLPFTVRADDDGEALDNAVEAALDEQAIPYEYFEIMEFTKEDEHAN